MSHDDIMISNIYIQYITLKNNIYTDTDISMIGQWICFPGSMLFSKITAPPGG